MSNNVLLQGDCRQLLQNLPKMSIACCIADPPYGDTSLDWDKPCQGWVEALRPVLMSNASVWVFGSFRFLAPLFLEMEKHGFSYAQDLVWEKQNGTGAQNDRFRRVHEHVVQFYLGPWKWVYKDPQFTLDAKAKTVRRKERPKHWGKIENSTYVSYDGGPRLVRSVLKIRNLHGKALHPTQKPIELLEPLIRYSCPPGQLLLDLFSGVGSTAVAARKLGYKTVSMEKNSFYMTLAEKRLRGDL